MQYYALLGIGLLNLAVSGFTLYAIFKGAKKVTVTIDNTQAVAEEYKAKMQRALAELAK
jgi:hypothetical protein